MTDRPKPTEAQLRLARKLYIAIVALAGFSFVCGILALVLGVQFAGYTMLIFGIVIAGLGACGLILVTRQLRP
jgi:hypothetical protein